MTTVNSDTVESWQSSTVTLLEQGDWLQERMAILGERSPVRFGDNSVLTAGTGMPFDQWIFGYGSQSEPTHRIDYRPLNEHDVYLFLERNTAVDLPPYLGDAAQFIAEMRLDLQAGALPILKATFDLGTATPVQPIMTRLLGLSDGPLTLTSHTLSINLASEAILDAEFVIDNRNHGKTSTFRPELTHASEPAPEQLPKTREPETRFREWSTSVEGRQRKG